jgi:hypothetical protein
LPVGEEAEVADAYEAAREQVEEEAAQELMDGQSQKPLQERHPRTITGKYQWSFQLLPKQNPGWFWTVHCAGPALPQLTECCALQVGTR